MENENTKNCCIPDRQNNIRNANDVLGGSRINRLPNPIDCVSVNIGGDWFDMGCAQSPHPEDGEGPVRPVWVDRFSLATTAVSNREFQRFVGATHYRTEAERAGSSFVFHLLLDNPQSAPASSVAPWWCDVADACWHKPEGAGSAIDDRWDHPVVHITRHDALQYCQWSGTRLATEAEWECAARGGLTSEPYPWGDELLPDGEHCCNIWQGDFPNSNTRDDGYSGTAPVTEYDSNPFGLFNMTGNVWEWVSDRFTNMHSPRQVKNPKGPLNGDRFVAKGGSYLCHESYCLRYRTSSRQALVASISAGNLGFRVAMDTPLEQSFHHPDITV